LAPAMAPMDNADFSGSSPLTRLAHTQ